MDSCSKRPRLLEITQIDDQHDRLSSFPDSILCHILSFLPTKHAAKTSLLSTRWKYVFLGVPNIDIDEYVVEDYHDSREEFLYFLNRRLQLCRTASMAEFRVKFRRMPKSSLINSWIAFLLGRKIQVLDIQVGRGYNISDVHLPREIFSCETLTVLKLSSFLIKVPEYVRLPNLKVFHLKYVLMESSSCLVFAEGYPLLEDLIIDNVRYSMNETLRISIPSLRKFTFNGVGNGLTSRIDIDTPLVQYLVFSCGELDMNLNSTCESLVELALSFSISRVQNTSILRTQWFSDIFRKIINVKSLKLSMNILEGLYQSTGSLPQFLKLTHLELKASNDYQRKSMWILLQNAPNLEMLVCDLEHGTGTEYGAPEVDPLCLTQNLTKISIRKFKGSAVNLEVLRYLLQQGVVLEKMVIDGCHNESYRDWPPSIWKPLLQVRRGSTKCEIEVT